MIRIALCALILCRFAGGEAAGAESKAPEVQIFTQRVLGLFAPDREADLRAALAEFPGVELVSVDYNFGEATFRLDPATAFPDSKPADASKRLGEKLRSSTRSTFSLQPLDPSVKKDELQRIELGVAGLDCRACSLAAYEAVAKVDGVYQATASFKEGKVTALIEPRKTDRAALSAALKKRNVKVTEDSVAQP